MKVTSLIVACVLAYCVATASAGLCDEDPLQETGACQLGGATPEAQDGLQNCIWYKDCSCCSPSDEPALNIPQECGVISDGCKEVQNLVTCLRCSPESNQLSAGNSRYTVCSGFATRLWNACKDDLMCPNGEVCDANNQLACKTATEIYGDSLFFADAFQLVVDDDDECFAAGSTLAPTLWAAAALAALAAYFN